MAMIVDEKDWRRVIFYFQKRDFVLFFRQKKWRKISSDLLVPGDIVSIGLEVLLNAQSVTMVNPSL
jgi:hypothetical protein